jgi:hypothetical protein
MHRDLIAEADVAEIVVAKSVTNLRKKCNVKFRNLKRQTLARRSQMRRWSFSFIYPPIQRSTLLVHFDHDCIAAQTQHQAFPLGL